MAIAADCKLGLDFKVRFPMNVLVFSEKSLCTDLAIDENFQADNATSIVRHCEPCRAFDKRATGDRDIVFVNLDRVGQGIES